MVSTSAFGWELRHESPIAGLPRRQRVIEYRKPAMINQTEHILNHYPKKFLFDRRRVTKREVLQKINSLIINNRKVTAGEFTRISGYWFSRGIYYVESLPHPTILDRIDNGWKDPPLDENLEKPRFFDDLRQVILQFRDVHNQWRSENTIYTRLMSKDTQTKQIMKTFQNIWGLSRYKLHLYLRYSTIALNARDKVLT